MSTHQSTLVIGPFLAFHHGTVDIGHNIVSVSHSALGVGDYDMCVDGKFSLEADDQQHLGRSNGTHLEDMKNLIELRFPGCDHLFVVLRVEKT